MFVGQCFREPEIQHLDGTVRPDFDVGGLQIPVDDPLRVGRFERVGNLPGDRQRFIERERSGCDTVGERRALDQLEDQRVGAVRLLEAEDRPDVGMVDRCEHLGFALEPGEAVRIERETVGENLERDVPIQRGITGVIHLAHSAFANFRDDFVGPQFPAYLHRDPLASARLRRSSRRLHATRAEAGPPAPISARTS